MASGGARARSGPPPDPNALRRDRPSDQAEWVHLPSAGRQSDAPEWPLPRPSARERAVWVEEWRRPQALMWEANQQVRQVAMYVRASVEAERRMAKTEVRNYVKQQEEILGISLTGLARNRWIIDDGTQGQTRATPTDDPKRASAKKRFQTIDGGAAS